MHHVLLIMIVNMEITNSLVKLIPKLLIIITIMEDYYVYQKYHKDPFKKED